MPWCDDCEKYWAPSAMTPEGDCPTCGADLEAPDLPTTATAPTRERRREGAVALQAARRPARRLPRLPRLRDVLRLTRDPAALRVLGAAECFVRGHAHETLRWAPAGPGGSLGDRHTGCGAVWLARLTGGQEVGSSNLPSPTTKYRSEPVPQGTGSFRFQAMYPECMQRWSAPILFAVQSGPGRRARGPAPARQVGAAPEGYDPATGNRRVRQLGTFETKRAAVAQQRALLDGRAGTDGETLSEFLERSGCPPRRAGSRRRPSTSTRGRFGRHIVPLHRRGPASGPHAELVDGWVGRAGHARRARAGPDLGRHRPALVRKVLSMALEEAVQRGRLPRNPVAAHPAPPAGPHPPAARLDTRRSPARSSPPSPASQRRVPPVPRHRPATRRTPRTALGGRRPDPCQLYVRPQLALERGRPVLKQLKTEHSRTGCDVRTGHRCSAGRSS